MKDERIFQSYPYHMRFEFIAREHPDFEKWLWNHYTQLVFEAESGQLDFAYLDSRRCALLESIENYPNLIETGDIAIADYIRHYLKEGYRIWVVPRDPAVGEYRYVPGGSFIDNWTESENQFQCFYHKSRENGNRESERWSVGHWDRESWSISEDELTELIRSRDYRIVSERVRLGLEYPLNLNKIVRNIKCYRNSQPLPGPKGYYCNQKETAIYGIEACKAWSDYYRERKPDWEREEVRERFRASVCVLLEHKALMLQRIKVIADLTDTEIIACVEGIRLVIQEYEKIYSETRKLTEEWFAMQSGQWDMMHAGWLNRIWKMAEREQEVLDNLWVQLSMYHPDPVGQLAGERT